MIEEGFRIGLGLAAAFAALWVAGWLLVLLLVALDGFGNPRESDTSASQPCRKPQ